MKTDVLALGFITDKDDAVLFRVDSGTSQDYLELEIVCFVVLSNNRFQFTVFVPV